jgi:putative membrane protein
MANQSIHRTLVPHAGHRYVGTHKKFFSSAREEDSMNYKLILILILAGLGVLFIIQNVAVVEIQFLFWSIQLSRSLLIFFLLSIGILIGWFLQGYLKYRKGKSNHGV